jgi:uncharacterized protein
MPELIPDSWTDPQFLPVAYSLALLAFGLVCLGILFVRRHRWQGLPAPGVTAWQIGWLDITILFCLLIMWSFMVTPVSRRLMPLPDPAPADMLAWQTALDATLLQVGMVAIFIFFWFSQPFEKRPAFNTARMDGRTALACALFYFLAFIPPRFGVEMAWSAALKEIQSLGIPVPMDEQSVVNSFDGSAPPLAYITLILVAGVLAPIVEELVFRAGLYRFLKGQAPRNSAIIISAGLFAFLHMNVLVFPTLMLLGVALCLSYEATGNIKVPIAFHALFNLNSILLIAMHGPHAGP